LLLENGPTVESRTSSTSTPLPDWSICWIFWSAWSVGGEMSCTLMPAFFDSKSAISFFSSAVRVGLVRLSTICSLTSPWAFSAGPGPQAVSARAAAITGASSFLDRYRMAFSSRGGQGAGGHLMNLPDRLRTLARFVRDW